MAKGTKAAPTAMRTLEQRFDRLLDTKEGPGLRRIQLAINEGLMRKGERGGLGAAMHGVALARICLGEEERKLPLEEPENCLASLAIAAAALEEVLHNVALELDAAGVRP